MKREALILEQYALFLHSNLLAEPARHLGVSPCAISKAVKKRMKE